MTRQVLLGPKMDLHLGVHHAFAQLLHPDFQCRKRDCVHTFVMTEEQQESPFSSFHWGEFVDFGPGRAMVHTARWPVLHRQAWVTDTDDFVYPVVCGRHVLSPDFRGTFRGEWPAKLRQNILARTTNMLTAYAHPSCQAIFYRSESAVRDARLWLEELGMAELAEVYLSKIQVIYPAQESCSADVMAAKWKKDGPLTVVFCGRDYESKNGRMALETFDRLSREFVTARFVYIGTIPPEELWRCREAPASVVHHASLPHQRILSILRAAHILFHPSKFEGLGTIFLEAAASGMAVITATGGAMRHVEELFGTGGAMLVDRDLTAPSNEASAFEACLRHLLRNPGVAKRLAYHNFKLTTVGKLSAERSRRILRTVYERALERPAATGLTLRQIPCPGKALVRFSSRQLEQEERDYRRQMNITQSRFLL